MFVSGFFHKPIVADAVREVVPCGLCPHNSIKGFKNMKITKEDLQKIVQEEFEKEIQEQQLTEKQVEEIFGGKLRSKANTAYNTVKDKLLGKKPTAPATQTTRSQPQIARFTQGPSSDPTQSQATTSSTVPSATGAATQTAGPGETATTATTQPATGQPAQSQPEKSKLRVNILPPVESEPEEKPSAQMDFFTDLAPKIKKDEELKQTWQKMFDSAKKEPNQMNALERLKAIADSSQAHPDIKKQAKQLVDRYLNESKNKTYNKTYDKWQKFIKG